MGLFLQYALFPKSKEDTARRALEAVSENPDFFICPERCRYAETGAGTQAFICQAYRKAAGGGFLVEGDLEPEPFARALFMAAAVPVMLLYIYDGAYWGYEFYAGEEESHFCTYPDYFGPITREEKGRLSGDPAMLARWFPIQDIGVLRPYLLHWSEQDGERLEGAGTACPGDVYSYGDCRQVTDFAARLGFPWAFDEAVGYGKPPLPPLKEILKKRLPPVPRAPTPEEASLLWELPSSFSLDYVRRLLREDGIQGFGFEDMTPQEIMDAVNAYRRSAVQAERDLLCQRLAVLGAFCAFWLNEGNPWGFLDKATYEPVCLRYEKPSDVYVLRARAAVTEFVKRHRALRDLKRLLELDPKNQEVYQAELMRWKEMEEQWRRRNSIPADGRH